MSTGWQARPGARSTGAPFAWARPWILPSKLALPPPPPHAIPRPRLDEHLLASSDATVVVVTGPAGCGKTVAVRDWLARGDERVAWVALDEADDHPLRFWHYVLTALERTVPGAARQALELLFRSAGLDDAFVGVCANDIGRMGERVVLVLDDLHTIQDRRVLQGLEYLVEHAPRVLRVVVVSRGRPHLPLGRWRARGELCELTEAQLSFTPEEAAAFLGSFEDVDLDADEVAQVTARTEGWVAGLQLAALTLRDRDDPSERVRRLAGDVGPIADYLLAEVLDRQTSEIRDFLCATSVVERFNLELCRTFTGRPDAQAVLERLESDGLFVVALDGDREWFRYHQLFRELLVTDLERRAPDRARDLRHAAARWFADGGDLRLAVGLLVSSGDPEEAFELAVTPAQPGFEVGVHFLHTEWLDLFPSSFIASDPERMMQFAVALGAGGRLADATVWIEQAEEALARDEPLPPDFSHRLAVMRALVYALRGDAQRAVDEGERALAAVDYDIDDDLLRERLWVHLARCRLMLDDVEGARATIERFASSGDRSVVATSLLVPAVRATVAAAAGELAEAERLATHALLAAETMDMARHFGTLDARVARATAFIERDELDAAEEDLHELLDLAAEFDSIPYSTLAELGLGRVVWARVGAAAAMEHVTAARMHAARADGPTPARRVDAFEARLRIETGEVRRAAELVAELHEGTERTLLEARLDLGDRPSETRALLAALHPTGLRDRIVAALLLARVAVDAGDALRHVVDALDLAETAGFVRVIAEETADPRLRALRHGLSGREGGRRPVVDGLDFAPSEALTDRERSLLRSLAGPMTNGEIAQELFISRNTLKSHLRNIYRKLGASSRQEAVANARRLGLL